MSVDDPKLRQLFQEQRARDERTVLPFHTVRARALTKAESVRPVAWAYRLAFAAALVAAVGVAGMIFWRAPRQAALPQVASAGSIGDWTSPTDSLLETPGSDWLGKTSLSDLSVADSLGNTKENL